MPKAFTQNSPRKLNCSKLGDDTHVSWVRGPLPAMTSEETEAALRYEWWCNHGCPDARYGDDGEMQCGLCVTDFKRLPLSDLQAHVALSRLRALQPEQARLRNLLASQAAEPD